jgi:hypothetical protein
MFAHLGIETLLVSMVLLLALVCPQAGDGWIRRIERGIGSLARRRGAAIMFCGLSPLVLRLALLPWLPVPLPFINDEFSFLLAGDTFAHGRVTNPPHPMWIHFETFHVIFHPTYASMYPPLQGLVLAAGQVLVHNPFWGVWLSVGVMSAAFCWMLQAWLPASWAFLGGMIPVLRFGTFSYWDNSYWGGALAATGGALLLGAAPRVMRHLRARDALLMGIAIAMLANTRPYEGMMLTVAVGVWVLVCFIRKTPRSTHILSRMVIPLMLVLVVTGTGTAYYFWRVTGAPTKLPQQLNRDTYAIAKYFYWQPAYPEPAYHHKEIRDFYGVELAEFNSARTASGVLLQWTKACARGWAFFVSPLLTLPLLFLPQVIRKRRMRFLVMAGLVGIGSSALVIFFNINYVAPIACVIVTAIVQGMRYLRLWKFEGRNSGTFLVRTIVVMCVMMIPVQVHLLAATPAPGTWASIGTQRAAVAAQLASLPGSQLVLVRYEAKHDPMLEWVYNGADIDRQKIVWARDMGASQNEELLRYYSARRVWLLEVDRMAPRLTEYCKCIPQVTAEAKNMSTAQGNER